MPVSPRLAIAGPIPAEGWLSIERYASALVELARLAGYSPSRVVAPDAPPGRFAGYRARYRSYPQRIATLEPPDLLHIADQALGHLATATTATTLVTCHDVMPLVLPGHYRGAFERWTDLALLRRSYEGMRSASLVIAVSERTRCDLAERLDIPPERVAVVPNVVGREFTPARPGARPRAGARPSILSVGSTRPGKNLEALLHALATPPLRGVELVRAGALLTPAQRDLATRLGIAGRVHELGPQPPPALVRLYRSATVFAMPSHYEGFGVPVIEAMACGTPVVSSTGGALPEICGGAARLVENGAHGVDPGRFAEALAEVVETPAEAARLGERGLARAECFRSSAVAPRLRAAYRSVTREHG